MLVYDGTSEQFIQEVRENTITDRMLDAFYGAAGFNPSQNEITSWQNSLPRVRDLLEIEGHRGGHVALEYQIPYNSNRLDCLLFGRGSSGAENVVLIELKQWSSVKPLTIEGNFVETYVGGGEQVVPHPSQQVMGYHEYLKQFVVEFENHPPLNLYSCAYCLNYSKKESDGLFHSTYSDILKAHPIYAKGDTKALAAVLAERLRTGGGTEIFNRFMRSRIEPSKKLLDNVAEMVKGDTRYALLNEQIVAMNLIWSHVRKARKAKKKTVIIVHGGPGTGKSLIAVHVLAKAAGAGMKKIFYGCKSKPFTEGMQSLVGPKAKALFSTLNRFIPSRVEEDELDLLLVDEAHRIGKTSNMQFTRLEDRTDMPQVDQLIRAARVSVFFIDDRQNVRSQEIGHSDLIREAAARQQCELYETELLTQFRCMGSNNYVEWVESVLGYSEEKRVFDTSAGFEFKIFDDPAAMYKALLKHEKEKANSARLVAGFCWPWSDKLDANGELVKDVVIGDFAMPWETHMNIKSPPRGYVPWYQWAYRPEGIKQVGCIYTAQGFEFDYVGVIIGDDLKYDKVTGELIADITATRDPKLRIGKEKFGSHVRNIYRTLLTRGMRGCYVYFVNPNTKRYFQERLAVKP